MNTSAHATFAVRPIGAVLYGSTLWTVTVALAWSKSLAAIARLGASMLTTIESAEPCMCGDPQCQQCFPVQAWEYRAAMLEQCLLRIRQVALDGGIPAAMACREIADIVAHELDL